MIVHEKLKFAVIGCGRIGKKHIDLVKVYGELVCVCDNDFETLEMVIRDNNVPGFESIEDILLNNPIPDVVVICTPNYLHASQSIYFLERGVHVLCEKPMALNSKDCAAMINAATLNNRFLFVVKQNRFNPAIVLLKDLLTKGCLGDVYSVQVNCYWNRNDDYYSNNWRGSLRSDGGILFTQFSHFIDIMYWLFGDVVEVSGVRKNFMHQNSIEFEDTGIACISFKTGIVGSLNYTINAYRKNMEGSITIFGKEGTVKVGGEYLNKLEYFEVNDMATPMVTIDGLPNDYGTYKGSMSNHPLFYDFVLNVFQSGSTNVNSTLDAMKTVEIIEKIYSNSVFVK